jgi:hypothetical protein
MNKAAFSVWSDPTALAQVTTPAGTGYVPYAQNHRGFVVQRRYRGVGVPHRTPASSSPNWCEPLLEDYALVVQSLTPVLHSAAVLAAGLDYNYLAEQAQLLGLDILTHPTYGDLCLRWGENAYGYHVFAAPVPAGTAQGAQTPFTDWASGITYYRQSITLTPASPLRDALSELTHQVFLEQGVGGGPKGWYATNPAALAQIITTAGEPFTVQQCESVYRIELTLGPEGPPDKVWDFVTAEAAYAWYTHLASPLLDPQIIGQASARLVFATTERLNGQIMTDVMHMECWVSATSLRYTASAPAQAGAPGPIPSRLLSEAEQPSISQVPTIRHLLSTLPLSVAQLNAQLELSAEALQQRLHNPYLWTLAELQRLAAIAELPMTLLLTRMARELNW